MNFKFNKNLCEENMKCTICLVEFIEHEKIRLLQCMHRFHKGCVEPWLGEFII